MNACTAATRQYNLLKAAEATPCDAAARCTDQHVTIARQGAPGRVGDLRTECKLATGFHQWVLSFARAACRPMVKGAQHRGSRSTDEGATQHRIATRGSQISARGSTHRS